MEVKIKDNAAICIINKNLTAVNVKEMVENLKEAMNESDDFEYLSIDLSKAESIDSMGITFLVGIYRTMEAKGKKTKLRGVSKQMQQLFRVMRLDDVFEIDRS